MAYFQEKSFTPLETTGIEPKETNEFESEEQLYILRCQFN